MSNKNWKGPRTNNWVYFLLRLIWHRRLRPGLVTKVAVWRAIKLTCGRMFTLLFWGLSAKVNQCVPLKNDAGHFQKYIGIYLCRVFSVFFVNVCGLVNFWRNKNLDETVNALD